MNILELAIVCAIMLIPAAVLYRMWSRECEKHDATRRRLWEDQDRWVENTEDKA